MSKRFYNLDILCNKLQARYGDSDDLVLQLKQELAALKAKGASDNAKKSFGRRPFEKFSVAQSVH